MGRELYEAFPVARTVFEEADEALGFSISRLCFDGPEDELRLTENTQPAILTVSIAALRVLAERGVRSHFAAGHSLGEYSAQVAAGTLSFADAVRTVTQSRTIYAGSGAGRRGRDGSDSGHDGGFGHSRLRRGSRRDRAGWFRRPT